MQSAGRRFPPGRSGLGCKPNPGPHGTPPHCARPGSRVRCDELWDELSEGCQSYGRPWRGCPSLAATGWDAHRAPRSGPVLSCPVPSRRAGSSGGRPRRGCRRRRRREGSSGIPPSPGPPVPLPSSSSSSRSNSSSLSRVRGGGTAEPRSEPRSAMPAAPGQPGLPRGGGLADGHPPINPPSAPPPRSLPRRPQRSSSSSSRVRDREPGHPPAHPFARPIAGPHGTTLTREHADADLVVVVGEQQPLGRHVAQRCAAPH